MPKRWFMCGDFEYYDEERFLNRYFKGGNCDLLGKDPFNNLT